MVYESGGLCLNHHSQFKSGLSFLTLIASNYIPSRGPIFVGPYKARKAIQKNSRIQEDLHETLNGWLG